MKPAKKIRTEKNHIQRPFQFIDITLHSLIHDTFQWRNSERPFSITFHKKWKFYFPSQRNVYRFTISIDYVTKEEIVSGLNLLLITFTIYSRASIAHLDNLLVSNNNMRRITEPNIIWYFIFSIHKIEKKIKYVLRFFVDWTETIKYKMWKGKSSRFLWEYTSRTRIKFSHYVT